MHCAFPRTTSRFVLPPDRWYFGLPHVETQLWALDVDTGPVLFGFTVSLPFGILLGAWPRSNFATIKMLCVLFIEVVRGIPLITVLFLCQCDAALFLPDGWTFDKLLRALIVSRSSHPPIWQKSFERSPGNAS